MYYEETIESFGRKIDDIKITCKSLSENHIVALSYPKIVKINDTSKGENLSEVPKDEGSNLPLSAMHLEKLAVLEKKATPVNVGIEEAPKITFYVESLLDEEHKNLAVFLKEKRSNFAWSYIDMPRINPEVVVHHLVVYPEAKPIKKKLRKMHPQNTLGKTQVTKNS